MRKSRLRLFIYVLTVVFVLLAKQEICYAESGLQLLTKTTALTQGQEFRVVIAVTPDTPDLACFGPIVVEFDPSRFSYAKSVLLNGDLEFEGSLNSSNQVILQGYSKTGGGVEVSGLTYLVGVYFNAIGTGSGDIQIKSVDGFADQDLTPIAMSAGASISFSVAAPVILSGNCNLASLIIDPGTLSPAFSVEQTAYAAEVATTVSQITVSATAEDSKAAVSVVGNTNLQDGVNEIQVIVTAEDGTKKTYAIAVTRTAPSPTPAVGVTIEGTTWTIRELPADTAVPDGFYHSLSSVSGRMVPSYKALKGEMELFYLVGPANQSGFYYLDSASQIYKPYQVILLPSRTFPVLIPGVDVSVPAGFSETTLNLADQSCLAWRQDIPDPALAGRDVYLVYLMNSKGDKAFYWFDKDSLLLSLYGGALPAVTVTPTPPLTPAVSTAPTPTEAAAGTATPFNPWLLVSILLAFFCLVLCGLIAWLATRKVGLVAGGQGNEDSDPSGVMPAGKRQPLKKPNIRRID